MDIDQLKTRYYGSLAATYDQERMSTPLWRHEQRAMSRVLCSLPSGWSVLDVPIGTGRFLPIYDECGLKVTGADASTEMLEQSRGRAATIGMDASLYQSDIRSLPFADKTFDAAVCMRFLNWLTPQDVYASVNELVRVTRHTLILGLRCYKPLRGTDLRRAGSLWNHVLQLKLRFYSLRTREQFICHEPSVARNIFEVHRLQLEEKIPIPMPLPSDYSIYVAKLPGN